MKRRVRAPSEELRELDELLCQTPDVWQADALRHATFRNCDSSVAWQTLRHLRHAQQISHSDSPAVHLWGFTRIRHRIPWSDLAFLRISSSPLDATRRTIPKLSEYCPNLRHLHFCEMTPHLHTIPLDLFQVLADPALLSKLQLPLLRSAFPTQRIRSWLQMPGRRAGHASRSSSSFLRMQNANIFS